MRRTSRRDPHARINAAVLAMAGAGTRITHSSSRPWASATFQGARHSIALRIDAPDASMRVATLTDLLPEAEFALPGHVVADLAIDGTDQGTAPCGDSYGLMRLSVLTVEDW